MLEDYKNNQVGAIRTGNTIKEKGSINYRPLMKGVNDMLTNILSFIGMLLGVTIIGLVIASLFGIFALIYLKLKQVSLRIENDPNANPFEHDDKEQFAKE